MTDTRAGIEGNMTDTRAASGTLMDVVLATTAKLPFARSQLPLAVLSGGCLRAVRSPMSSDPMPTLTLSKTQKTSAMPW